MMTESRMTRWMAWWMRWGCALTLALLGALGATAEIGFAQTCIQKEYYNFSVPYVLDTANGGKWQGTTATISRTGLSRQGRALKFVGNATLSKRKDTAIINKVDFSSSPEGRLAFRYKSNVGFDVYCGSATNKLTKLATIPAKTRPATGVARTLTLTPAACGINSTTLGDLYVKFVGVNMNRSTKYIYLDNVSLATCPQLSFVDPDTGEDLEDISLAEGDSKVVQICIYGTDDSGARSETVPIGKTANIDLSSANSSVVSMSSTSVTIAGGQSCSPTLVTIARGTGTNAVALTAKTSSSSGIQYFPGTLNVGVSGLRFADTSGNTITSISSLYEDTTGGKSNSASIKVCLPIGVSAPAEITVLLDESGDLGDIATEATDKDRVSTIPSTGLVNEETGESATQGVIYIRVGKNCSDDNITITLKDDSITNAYSGVMLTAVRSDIATDTAELEVPLVDDEAPTGEWSWELREPMVLTPGGSVSAAIITSGGLRWQVFNDPSKCSAEQGYSAGDYAGCELACPYIAKPPATTTNTQSITYSSDPPSEVPFNITSPKPIPDDKVNKKVCVCVKNQDDASTTGTKCKSIPTLKAGAQIFLPTFLMTASYDWTHNFYDNNMEADTATVNDTYSDQDTDNFNKIVLVDSNLFPIYTALNGDQEFPNIVMRNWTSGTAVRSPSVNDYMNRSVVAVGNYEATPLRITFGLKGRSGMTAVGMRKYMEWVYALDPANNNFRRYKFVSIDDREPVVPFFDKEYVKSYLDMSGDATFAGTTDNSGIDCPTCDPNYWYGVSWSQSVNAYDNKCPQTCYDTTNDGIADIKFLMYAKKQAEGMTDTGINPPIRFQYPISIEAYYAGGTVDVSQVLNGFKTANDATMNFLLNNDSSDASCKQSTTANSGDSSYGLAAGGCGTSKGQCRAALTVSFDDVSVECASNCDDRFCYMTIDMLPLDKQHGGWFIEIPTPPPATQIDNAFRIPIPGIDDTTVTPPTNAADYRRFVERRWGNIGAYLDTVPPESYAGYRNYTSVRQRPGYGSRTQGYFQNATGVRFKDPRDIDAYRDYFDAKNGGPIYIFVADTGNNRVQVFMNATGVAGDVGATAPIRPVRVNVSVGGTPKATAADTNEIGWRRSNAILGDGRRGDWRGEMTQNGSGKWEDEFKDKTYGAGEFYYPHGVAVDQDPDSKDVYLFVADTFNHRIQVFRDVSGVSSQNINAKNFHFEFVTQFGTYPLQTGVTKTAPGPFALRYPKGLDVVRFLNNSSYLYVVDSKNYRVMKYQIGENPAAANGISTGITKVEAVKGYGHDGSAYSKELDSAAKPAKPRVVHDENPGFLDPQDVATGYTGFFIYTSPNGKGTQFLNNYMIYVTDAARNNTTLNPRRVSARVFQMIDVPSMFSSISGVPIRWETARKAVFSTHTSRIWRRTDSTTTFPFNLTLGQSPFGLKLGRAAFELYSSGVYHSRGQFKPTGGSSSNVPGRTVGAGETTYSYFTDRPFGVNALHWNTLKPIDIRLIEHKSAYTATDIAYVPGDKVDVSKPLRIGVSSRYMSFGQPYNRALSFLNASTNPCKPLASTSSVSNCLTAQYSIQGPWDALYAGRVHLFCYDKAGAFKNYTVLYPERYNERYKNTASPLPPKPSYAVTLPTSNCVSGGILKIVAEDKDFAYSARSGTAFYLIK